jgi:5-methylcytosine-specific restriction endonuclease McrA
MANCKNCGISYKPRSSDCGLFCSNECQQIFKIKKNITEWVNGTHKPSPQSIRRYLLLLKNHKCEICGTVLWNDIPVTLEVDHIDGDSTNNVITNLRLICPNCHAQTDTYKSKNRGKGRSHRRQRWKEGKTV